MFANVSVSAESHILTPPPRTSQHHPQPLSIQHDTLPLVPPDLGQYAAAHRLPNVFFWVYVYSSTIVRDLNFRTTKPRRAAHPPSPLHTPCWPIFFLSSAYKAVHETIAIVKSFAEEEDTMPLNVALEMRFTKHSDTPICPAFGKEVHSSTDAIAARGVFLIWSCLCSMGCPCIVRNVLACLRRPEAAERAIHSGAPVRIRLSCGDT